MRIRAKRLVGNVVTDKKFKGQSLGRATCCSSTESKLETYDFNAKDYQLMRFLCL